MTSARKLHFSPLPAGGTQEQATQGLTLPVMLVVTHSGQGDHHSTVEGQDGSTKAPALAPPALSEAVQFASQVEGREAEAREGN